MPVPSPTHESLRCPVTKPYVSSSSMSLFVRLVIMYELVKQITLPYSFFFLWQQTSNSYNFIKIYAKEVWYKVLQKKLRFLQNSIPEREILKPMIPFKQTYCHIDHAYMNIYWLWYSISKKYNNHKHPKPHKIRRTRTRIRICSILFLDTLLVQA